jgi:hypothetical protein
MGEGKERLCAFCVHACVESGSTVQSPALVAGRRAGTRAPAARSAVQHLALLAAGARTPQYVAGCICARKYEGHQVAPRPPAAHLPRTPVAGVAADRPHQQRPRLVVAAPGVMGRCKVWAAFSRRARSAHIPVPHKAKCAKLAGVALAHPQSEG